MSAELILVVCTANVCRSPLAELLLRSGLEAMPEVRAVSAGTQADAGGAVCPLVAEHRAGDAWTGAALAHRSRPVTSELLTGAALILVAARDVRSDVVRLVPEVRERTYTLREAAHLGEGFAPTDPSRRLGIISRYAMHLDLSRASSGPVPTGRLGRWRAQGTDGSTIVDGHDRDRRTHRRTLRAVADSTSAIIEQMGGRLGP